MSFRPRWPILESQVVLEVLRDLANQTLEGKLADQQVGRLLVAPNLAQSDSARAIAVRLRGEEERGRPVQSKSSVSSADAAPTQHA